MATIVLVCCAAWGAEPEPTVTQTPDAAEAGEVEPVAPPLEPLRPRDLPGVEASEVGEERRFGVGLALGFPPSGTVQFRVDRRHAVSLHVGPTIAIAGLEFRLQYENTARTLRTWPLGTLLLTWQVGTVVDLVFGQGAAVDSVRWGLHGGVGLELRLVPAPVAVFGEIAPVLYPFDLARVGNTPFVPVQGIVAFGARWYF